MSRTRSKYIHDPACLSLTHDGECDCPRPRTLRRSTPELQAAYHDAIARDRADRLSHALQRYGTARHAAMVAQQAFEASGDDAFRRSAEGHRADARAALHMHPDLLKMVEPS